MTQRHKITGDLVGVLRGFNPADFPNGIDYESRFNVISDHLRTNVHTEVEKSALFQSIADGKIPPEQAIYLNNHGPGHVDQVIERASHLLEATAAELSSYEVYLLLMAIQFHDVGNVYSRKEHEKKSQMILAKLGPEVITDNLEKRYIGLLAASHGGTVDGDKDTITKLQEDVALLGKYIRPRFLAATLRFADELADDSRRASRFMIEQGLVPAHSLIYHCYSRCLHSVMVKGSEREVRLSYAMTAEDARTRYAKNGDQVWLLDEIYDRTVKMHRERVYCMRHVPAENQFRRIRVTIEVYPDLKERPLEDPISLTYCLEEKGYPAAPSGGIHDVCPELRGYGGQQLYDDLAR